MTESTRSAKDTPSILFGLQNLSSLSLTSIRTPTDTAAHEEELLLEDLVPTLNETPPPIDELLLFEERAYPPPSLLVDEDWPTRPSLALYVMGLIIFFVLGAVCALLAVALL